MDVTDREVIWETFDSLFKTVHRQGRRVEELEARVVVLEERLQATQSSQKQTTGPLSAVNDARFEF